MRLFVGLRPTEDFLKALSALQEQLREAGVTARYLEKANLHMTLAFIGEWAEDVTQLLPPVGQPFPITLSHLGVFPEAAVLWAGVKSSEPLDDLARRVRHALFKAGIPFDRKGFNPHITLGRKPRIPEGVILSEIAVSPVSMLVCEVCLYRSDRGRNGMEYTVIGRV